MELEIRRMTPRMLDDYLDFFDNIAFADHPEWSQCYCLAFHFEPAWDAEDAERDNPWRKRAGKFVREKKIHGYDFIEGYPPAGECDMYAAHHGTVSLFEKCGFTLCKKYAKGAIMRKQLF